MRSRSARSLLVLIISAVLAGACSTADEDDAEWAGSFEMSEALADRTGPPTVRIAGPKDGDLVTSPLSIRVVTENFALAPAGRTRDGEGHFHILIDEPCLPPGAPIPATAKAIHVGTGSDVKLISLDPGRHTLCVQLGDGFHVALGITDEIEVTVVR